MSGKLPASLNQNSNNQEAFWKGVYLKLSTNPENKYQKYWSLVVADEASTLPSSGIQFITYSDQYSAALAGLDVFNKYDSYLNK